MYPEEARGEFATPEQLALLYRAAATWLERNGKPLSPAADVACQRMNDGLPILSEPVLIAYSIDGEVLRQLVPEAAETLQIDEQCMLIHSAAYYRYELDDAVSFQPGRTHFLIEKNVDAEPVLDEAVTIDGPESLSPWKTRREQYTSDLAASSRPENDIFHCVTAQEYRALEKIIGSLDMLKAAQDQRFTTE